MTGIEHTAPFIFERGLDGPTAVSVRCRPRSAFELNLAPPGSGHVRHSGHRLAIRIVEINKKTGRGDRVVCPDCGGIGEVQNPLRPVPALETQAMGGARAPFHQTRQPRERHVGKTDAGLPPFGSELQHGADAA